MSNRRGQKLFYLLCVQTGTLTPNKCHKIAIYLKGLFNKRPTSSTSLSRLKRYMLLAIRASKSPLLEAFASGRVKTFYLLCGQTGTMTLNRCHKIDIYLKGLFNKRPTSSTSLSRLKRKALCYWLFARRKAHYSMRSHRVARKVRKSLLLTCTLA